MSPSRERGRVSGVAPWIADRQALLVEWLDVLSHA